MGKFTFTEAAVESLRRKDRAFIEQAQVQSFMERVAAGNVVAVEEAVVENFGDVESVKAEFGIMAFAVTAGAVVVAGANYRGDGGITG
jgi:hypothetical protein